MTLKFSISLFIMILLIFGLVFLGMVLYQPSWYYYQSLMLKSDNVKKRELAAKTLSEKGPKSIPHLKRWMNSEDELLIIGACRALLMMDDNIWEEALAELERILSGIPSAKTDAVTEILERYSFAWQWNGKEILWLKYAHKKRIKLNILCYLLKYSSNDKLRISTAKKLALINNSVVVKRLAHSLKNDPNPNVRYYSALGVAIIANHNIINDLISIIRNEKNKRIKRLEIIALGRIKDPRGVEILISIAKGYPKKLSNSFTQIPGSNTILQPRQDTAGKKNAVQAIIELLSNEVTYDYCDFSSEPKYIAQWPKHPVTAAIRALGEIGDPRALGILEEIRDNGETALVTEYWGSSTIMGSENTCREAAIALRKIREHNYLDSTK